MELLNGVAQLCNCCPDVLSALIVGKYKAFPVSPETSLLMDYDKSVTQDVSAVLLRKTKTTGWYKRISLEDLVVTAKRENIRIKSNFLALTA